MSPLRVIALDIDGTLIDSRKEIMPFTRSEIHRVVREYGAEVVLITARGPESTKIIESRLGVQACYVSYGGSLVFSREHGGSLALVSEVALLTEDVASIVAIAATHDLQTGLYSRDHWYVNTLNYWALREARNTALWPVVADLGEVAASAGPFFKIMFRGETTALARLAADLAASPTTTYAHLQSSALELVSSAAVKLPGLVALAAHRGFDLDEVIAFGDTESDIGVLENVGVGLLMGNAANDLIVAGRVERTLSNDEDGIGLALRKYFPSSEPFLP